MLHRQTEFLKRLLGVRKTTTKQLVPAEFEHYTLQTFSSWSSKFASTVLRAVLTHLDLGMARVINYIDSIYKSTESDVCASTFGLRLYVQLINAHKATCDDTKRKRPALKTVS